MEMITIQITFSEEEKEDFVRDVHEKCGYTLTKEEIAKILPQYLSACLYRTGRRMVENGISSFDPDQFAKTRIALGF